MSTRVLSGTYTAGYVLSSNYSVLSIAASGEIQGGPGAHGRSSANGPGAAGGAGGDGLTVSFAADIYNAGAIVGGSGGGGGAGYSVAGVGGGAGGGGGAAVLLAGGAQLVNDAAIVGGHGGAGGRAPYAGAGGPGGAGGDGVDAGNGAIIVNAGAINGGTGGAGGYASGPYSYNGGAGGAGGTGVALQALASLANGGAITGGQGGAGGRSAYHSVAGAGAAGGVGVAVASGAGLVNDGVIGGGLGGRGGYGFGRYALAGAGGAGGDGVYLAPAGYLANDGAILGGKGGRGGRSQYHGVGAAGAWGDGVWMAGGTLVNGGASMTSALIAGAIGVYATVDGAVTVTNYAVIDGTGGVSVAFNSVDDRLITEAGSRFYGVVRGGGGTLELGDAAGTITGLGGAATLSGGEAMTFGGFGSYVIDGLGAWTLTGSNTLDAGADLFASGSLTNEGVLTADGLIRLKAVVIDNAAGTIAADGPAGRVFLAGGIIEGGVLSTAAGGLVKVVSSGVELDGSTGAIVNDGALGIAAGRYLLVRGAIDNAGVIQTDSQGGFSTGLIILPDTTFSGGGVVDLKGNLQGNAIVGVAGGSVLTNAGDTFAGQGYIGLGNDDLSLINQAGGVIDATGSNYFALNLDTGANTITNAGLIKSSDVGGVYISSPLANTGTVEAARGALVLAGGLVANAGGLIEAVGKSASVELEGVTVIGGRLATSHGGVIEAAQPGDAIDGSAGGVTNAGLLQINSSMTLGAEGAIANSGTIALAGVGGEATDLFLENSLTLTGGGALILSDNNANAIFANFASTLTNVDNTISGAGSIGNDSVTLINEAAGVIDASGAANPLIINLGGRAFDNAGLMESTGAGGLIIDSTLTNNGLLAAEGGDVTVNAAVSGAGSAVIAGATLELASAFDQAVRFGAPSGKLVLAQSQSYAATISGFSTSGGTALDLRDIGFVGAGEARFSGTAAGGVLSVSDGAHTAAITLAGDYLGTTFTASADGHGGTVVLDGPGAALAGGFAAAMAGLGAAGGIGHTPGAAPDLLSPVIAASR
jgi:hypothetical protein